ncbi:MAG: hypothetical protein QM204_04105 [Bacillota bacterium]|jgi:hypothetical protein|nr:hypothetical protein [Bacillota bacterium]NLL25897.1 hypothetical protein [Erysipelotrichia bacterium]
MNEILFRLKYNSLLHWVINGKIISKIFRVKEKAYRDYQLKHSLQKYMPAFDVLSDVIKHLIYLLVVSFASFNANDFVIWFMFLMVGGFSTKILNYDADMQILFQSFKIPFKDIFYFKLKRRFINRLSYALIFPIGFSLIINDFSYIPLMVFSIFFFMYFAESFTLLIFKIKKPAVIQYPLYIGMVVICLAFGFLHLNFYYLMIPMVIYLIASFIVIRKQKRADLFFDVFMKNIRDFDESIKSLDDLFTKETEMDKNVNPEKSLSIIQKYKSYNLYQYLFLSRHKRIWFKPLRNSILIQLAVYLVFTSILYLDIVPEADYQLTIVTLTNAYIFLLYLFDTGQKLIKAYYRNGDYHLLHYAFYRRKNEVYKQFLIRLKDAFVFSLVPILIGSFFSLIWIFGLKMPVGPTFNFIISVIFFTLFFNIHYLFIYYIFQPYNYDLDKPRFILTLFNIGIYTFAYMDKPWLAYKYLGVIFIIILIFYIIISTILVYHFAPKTFKYRD